MSLKINLSAREIVFHSIENLVKDYPTSDEKQNNFWVALSFKRLTNNHVIIVALHRTVAEVLTSPR